MQSIHQLKRNMTCAHLESCFGGKQNSVEMFVPICVIFIYKLDQYHPNNLISRFGLTVSLRVISCKANVSKQKMSGKDLDGFMIKWVPWLLTKVKGN